MIEYTSIGHVTAEDPKTGKKVTHRVNRIVRKYEPEERVQIVREYLNGSTDIHGIMEKYNIRSQSSFNSWLGMHVKDAISLSLQDKNENDSDMTNKSKDDQIRELKEKLRQAEEKADMEALRAKAFSKMIDVAEATFNIPVRKKFGTKQ